MSKELSREELLEWLACVFGQINELEEWQFEDDKREEQVYKKIKQIIKEYPYLKED